MRILDMRLGRFVSRFMNAVTVPPDRIARTPEQIEQFFKSPDDVTPAAAMRVAAVFGCVRLLASSEAMLPLGLYRIEGDEHVLDPTHAVARVLARPNDWQTAYEFESMMTAHKLLRGNAYAYIGRGSRSRPVSLIPLNPDRMQVEQAPDGSLQYRYSQRDGVKRIYRQEEIHHRRGLTTDGIYGLSPISAARKAISLAIQTESHGAALFTNGAKPSGVLKSPKPLTAEAARRLKDSFDDVYAGSDNAHKTIVLEDGLEWSQVGMSAEDSQFIESRKFQRGEIYMFFGVPPHMVGDVERGTSWGSGIEQQSLGFLVHTLHPHLINDQQSLCRDLLGRDEAANYAIRHDTSMLTRAEFLTRQQGLEIQLRNGVINADEWRKIEGLNPRKDGGGKDYVKASGGAPDPAALAAGGDQGGSADVSSAA